jgi:hypothetical protein
LKNIKKKSFVINGKTPAGLWPAGVGLKGVKN